MTDRHSRREFMGLTAAGVAGALTPPWLADARGVTVRAAQSPEPELIVHNAKVYTIDPAMPRQVKQESIAWLKQEHPSSTALKQTKPGPQYSKAQKA